MSGSFGQGSLCSLKAWNSRFRAFRPPKCIPIMQPLQDENAITFEKRQVTRGGVLFWTIALKVERAEVSNTPKNLSKITIRDPQGLGGLDSGLVSPRPVLHASLARWPMQSTRVST